MTDFELLMMLGLGFLLGARHALDADHIVAVSTMVSRRPTVRGSGLIGFWWGVGHTAMLLFVGMGMLALKITIPESIAHVFELLVGLMLVGLGISLAIALYREEWHLHVHEHEGKPHVHLHPHRHQESHVHQHWWQESLRPAAVGMVHGLAGSAAVMLVVLSAARTIGEGMVYILAFGAGSILGMVLLGILVSLPLLYSVTWGRHVQVALRGVASLGSIGLGFVMILRQGIGLLPF